MPIRRDNIIRDNIQHIEYRTRGKMQVDNDFGKYIIDKYKNVNVKRPIEIRGLIEEYKTFILEKYETTPLDPISINIMGLELHSGFNLLYGPPDYYKTSIGIHIANMAIAMGLSVVYVDAENKIIEGLLDDKVYYIPGSDKTHDILKTVLISDTIDLYIVDTIFTLSKAQLLLRSAVKHIQPYGNFMLMLNQTRNFRYGDYSPGPDIIEELTVNKYRLISRRSIGNKVYLRTDTGVHFVFNKDTNKLLYDYNIEESVLGTALTSGIVRKLLREYTYQNKTYSKTEIVELLLNDNCGNR